MKDMKVSHTALGTAYLRAAHQLLDPPPHILEDPPAVLLVGAEGLKFIRENEAHFRTPENRALCSHVVLRSRFAEDRLAMAVQRGVKRYVILGAGWDTFALRQPDWAREVRILEVDRSGTQEWKRSWLSASGLPVPPNLEFAAVDFEREPLRESLLRCGVSPDEPAFFSWLGVTMYLREEAVDSVLRTLAAFPAGSELVLTFSQPSAHADREGHSTPLAERVAAMGEPFVSTFEPDALRAKLLAAGFSGAEFLTPQEAGARYFQRCPQGLPLPRRISIASAVV